MNKSEWQKKQDHLQRQADRVSEDYVELRRMVAKLNAERKPGEPEFTLRTLSNETQQAERN